ncbi:MAG: monooxygenase [Actinomycetes bacterium]
MGRLGSARAATAVGLLTVLLAGCGGGGGTVGGTSPASSTAPTASTHAEHSGHTDQAVATTRSRPLRAGERFTTIGLPGGPYTPAAPSGGKDDYRCFLVDPHLTRDAFITGAEVLPGQPQVVHHAILFRVAPGQVAAARRHDAATPGKGWTCFGGSGVPSGIGSAAGGGALDSAPWLAAWAPGGGESVFGAHTGVRLAAGSQIVLQVHYNLREATPGMTDDTKVRLRLAPGTAHLQPLQTMLLPAPVELPCTAKETGPLCDRGRAVLDLMARFGNEAGRTVAGLQLLCGGNLLAPVAGPTQHCDRVVREPIVVRAVAGHMHLLGRSISVTLDPGRPSQRTLLDRKVWDFDNQKATPLPRPVRVQPGHTLRVTCTHDAGLRSLIPELRGEQPRYVTWGEGTADEMCLGIVLYTRG